MAVDLHNLYCAMTSCHEPVTHVCIQTTQLGMLFRSAAGLICEKHAQELEQYGGLSMPIPVYITTVAEEVEARG